LSTQNHCRVVLVRPRIAANLGATARVMRNFGFSQLILVAPEADVQDPRGRLLATHAEDILDDSQIVATFDEAVADCILVVGTSARTGGLFRRQSVRTLTDISPLVVRSSLSGPVAIVFGPEPNGLTDAEITRCHYLINIPTETEHAALNLAQAVAITLFELHQTTLKASNSVAEARGSLELAPFAAQEHLFSTLREALEAIHFLYGDKADSLMHGIRHLLGKAQLTEMEVNLLLGLARQMMWIARQPKSDEGGVG
jgi:tRNA/rRNA methyltransferase